MYFLQDERLDFRFLRRIFFRLNESNCTLCASFSRQWIYDSHSIGYFISILPIVADFT